MATLFAAFFGAWFAFLFERKQKAKETRETHIAASNRALFILLQQLNSLALIQKDFLDPLRGQPHAFLALQPILPDNPLEMSLDFQSIDFLFSTKHKQLLLDLALEEKRFREAVKLINYRSNLHYSQVQPKLIAAGIQEGTPYPNTLFEKALGPLLFATLKQVTDQVYYTVDRSVTTMDELKSRLLSGLKELFPEGDFLKFELIRKEANNRLHEDRS